MKSSIEIPNHTVAPTFPALYQSTETDSDLVVLFTDPVTGFVVVPSGLRNIGNTTNWHDCTKSGRWKCLPAGTKITLTQEGVL